MLPPGYRWPGTYQLDGGSLRWRGLPCGEYVLEVAFQTAGVKRQVLSIESPVQDVAVMVDPPQVVSVEVQCADGLGTQDLLITVEPMGPDGTVGEPIGLGALPVDGVVHVVGLEEGGSYLASASGHQGSGQTGFAVRGGETVIVKVSRHTATPAAMVELLEAESGRPLAGRTIMFSPETGLVAYAITGKDGHASLVPVAGTPAKARAMDDDYDTGWVKVTAGEVTRMVAERRGTVELVVGTGFAGESSRLKVTRVRGSTTEDGVIASPEEDLQLHLWEGAAVEVRGLALGVYDVQVVLLDGDAEQLLQEQVTVGSGGNWLSRLEISR